MAYKFEWWHTIAAFFVIYLISPSMQSLIYINLFGKSYEYNYGGLIIAVFVLVFVILLFGGKRGR